MKLIFIILFCPVSVLLFSQAEQMKLPAKFKNLEFGKMTIEDLGKKFAKPDTLIDNVVEERYQDGGGGLWGTIDAEYHREKIILHFKINDTTYVSYLSSVDILTGSPIIFGESICIGKTTKDEVKKNLGEPLGFNDPEIDKTALRYKVTKNLLCVFYSENDIITSARIIYNPLFKQ